MGEMDTSKDLVIMRYFVFFGLALHALSGNTAVDGLVDTVTGASVDPATQAELDTHAATADAHGSYLAGTGVFSDDCILRSDGAGGDSLQCSGVTLSDEATNVFTLSLPAADDKLEVANPLFFSSTTYGFDLYVAESGTFQSGLVLEAADSWTTEYGFYLDTGGYLGLISPAAATTIAGVEITEGDTLVATYDIITDSLKTASQVGFYGDSTFQFGTNVILGDFTFYVKQSAGPDIWNYPFYVDTGGKTVWIQGGFDFAIGNGDATVSADNYAARPTAFVDFNHDGTDLNVAGTSTTEINVTGVTGINIPDATTATHALNRQTADARYLQSVQADSVGTAELDDGADTPAARDVVHVDPADTTQLIYYAAPSGGTDGCAGTADKVIFNSTTGTWSCGTDAGAGGGMTSFTLAGDTGGGQTITDGNTVTIQGTTTGIDTNDTATDTVIVQYDASEAEPGNEAVLDLPDLQGAVTDAQVPNNITIDLATVATTANAGDTATAFFSAGTIEHERGGLEADVSAYSGIPAITAGATYELNTLAELNTAIGASLVDGHVSATAGETIAAGDAVNLYDATGTLSARLADATTIGEELDGFAVTGGAATATVTIAVLWGSQITGLTGLTAGSWYYLSTTAGDITATAPSGTGNVSQRAGKALTTTSLLFQPGEPIEQ